MNDWECSVVGGGVVGLACAAALSRGGVSTVVIEQHARFGQETSSRNSGVVHAGIHYPPGSLKAELCVRGRELLYERCHRDRVPHRKLGKLIVATSVDELDRLAKLQANASANGVDLTWLGRDEVRDKEPALSVEGALWSPETGIVDVHELMRSYRAEASECGATFALNTRLEAVESDASGWLLTCCARPTIGSAERFSTTARVIVNAAGLDSARVWELAAGRPVPAELRLHYCKGDYFALSSAWRKRVVGLVYPLPVEAGLGVHLTRDLGGGLLAGPDAEYVDERSLEPRKDKAAAFAESLRRFLPGVESADLTPAYSGLRPKLQAPGQPPRDFVIEANAWGGGANLVHLTGIESPGLTASEAIAERVQRLVLDLLGRAPR